MDIKDKLRFMKPLEFIANYGTEEFDEIIESLNKLSADEKNEFIKTCREQFDELKSKFEFFQSKL